jgi:hypothetical protein
MGLYGGTQQGGINVILKQIGTAGKVGASSLSKNQKHHISPFYTDVKQFSSRCIQKASRNCITPANS